MKKVLAILAAFVLICSAAVADINLSGMNYDELVALKDQIDLAIWNSAEWQEVSVPQGTYKIGEDIPAGHWTVKAASGSVCTVTYCDTVDEFGNADWHGEMDVEALVAEDTSVYDEANDLAQVDFDMKEGWYVVIEMGGVVFTPYSGKPSLGFK